MTSAWRLFAIVYTITYRFSHGGGNTLMFIRWMIVKTRSRRRRRLSSLFCLLLLMDDFHSHSWIVFFLSFKKRKEEKRSGGLKNCSEKNGCCCGGGDLSLWLHSSLAGTRVCPSVRPSLFSVCVYMARDVSCLSINQTCVICQECSITVGARRVKNQRG